MAAEDRLPEGEGTGDIERKHLARGIEGVL